MSIFSRCAPPLRVRWLIWILLLAVWTRGLLMRSPIDPGDDQSLRRNLFFISKFTHISAYAFFTLLAVWLRVPPRARWLLPAFLLLHGIATEYLQQYVPTRSGSWRDAGLDALGILVGMSLSYRHWLK